MGTSNTHTKSHLCKVASRMGALNDPNQVIGLPTWIRTVYGFRVGGTGEFVNFTLDYRLTSFQTIESPTYGELLISNRFYLSREVDDWNDDGSSIWYPSDSRIGIVRIINLLDTEQGISDGTTFGMGSSSAERLQPGSNVYITLISSDRDAVRNGAVNMPAGTVDMLRDGLYRVQPVQVLVEFINRLSRWPENRTSHFRGSGVVTSRTKVDREGIVDAEYSGYIGTREPRWLRSRQSVLSEKEQIRQNTRLSAAGRRGRRGATLRRASARSYRGLGN